MSVERVLAHAKVNLSLDLLGKRDDGYHALRSVMQLVSLHDVLTLGQFQVPSSVGAYCMRPESQVDVDGSASGAGGAHDFSLVDRAIAAVLAYAGVSARVSCTLEKRIPVAAGLGGGSSDAAATLRGVNRLLGLGLERAQLAKIGETLGSDVPFFLYGPTAMVEGRGERVTTLPVPPRHWLVLANAGEPVPTGAVFGAVRAEDFGDGRASDAVMRGLEAGTIVLGRNDLAGPVFRLFSRVRALYEQLTAMAPGRTGVSGSGGTVFTVCESREAAIELEARLWPKPAWTCVAATLDGTEDMT